MEFNHLDSADLIPLGVSFFHLTKAIQTSSFLAQERSRPGHGLGGSVPRILEPLRLGLRLFKLTRPPGWHARRNGCQIRLPAGDGIFSRCDTLPRGIHLGSETIGLFDNLGRSVSGILLRKLQLGRSIDNPLSQSLGLFIFAYGLSDGDSTLVQTIPCINGAKKRELLCGVRPVANAAVHLRVESYALSRTQRRDWRRESMFDARSRRNRREGRRAGKATTCMSRQRYSLPRRVDGACSIRVQEKGNKKRPRRQEVQVSIPNRLSRYSRPAKYWILQRTEISAWRILKMRSHEIRICDEKGWGHTGRKPGEVKWIS
jgi:hypothetical protein